MFSARWKMLLSFNCRNRLLLTGTPIQNSMAEVIVALLLSFTNLVQLWSMFYDITTHGHQSSCHDVLHSVLGVVFLSYLHCFLSFVLKAIFRSN